MNPDRIFDTVLRATQVDPDLHAFVIRNETAVRAAIAVALREQGSQAAPTAVRTRARAKRDELAAPSWPPKPKRGQTYATSSGEWDRAAWTLESLPEVQDFVEDLRRWRRRQDAAYDAKLVEHVLGNTSLVKYNPRENAWYAKRNAEILKKGQTPETLIAARADINRQIQDIREAMRIIDETRMFDPRTPFAAMVRAARATSIDWRGLSFLLDARGIDWPNWSDGTYPSIQDLYYRDSIDPDVALEQVREKERRRAAEKAENGRDYIKKAREFVNIYDDHVASGKAPSTVTRALPDDAKITTLADSDGPYVEMTGFVPKGWTSWRGPSVRTFSARGSPESRTKALAAFVQFLREVAKAPLHLDEDEMMVWQRRARETAKRVVEQA